MVRLGYCTADRSFRFTIVIGLPCRSYDIPQTTVLMCNEETALLHINTVCRVKTALLHINTVRYFRCAARQTMQNCSAVTGANRIGVQ